MNRYPVTPQDCWNLDGVILDFLIGAVEKFREEAPAKMEFGDGSDAINADTFCEDVLHGLYIGKDIIDNFVPTDDIRWKDFEYSWNLLGKFLFWLWT